ncbi:hypothetical protein GOBAR_AA35461 [Gossypium barbadense]|uniref:Uncharacterized protein n=1 Tax=Gossypium barbadense TaxID=3634 RepID=A0A2P5W2D6_GOSBA|nr:hypothetical protein GOBAR_AA35461 [Gossypium barbadense]
METMVALYCGNQGDQNAPVQLLAELVDVERIEDLTPLGEEHGAQEPCLMTDAIGDDGCGSSDPFDHEVDSGNPNMDEVSDDIDNKAVNDNRNVNASSFGS